MKCANALESHPSLRSVAGDVGTISVPVLFTHSDISTAFFRSFNVLPNSSVKVWKNVPEVNDCFFTLWPKQERENCHPQNHEVLKKVFILKHSNLRTESIEWIWPASAKGFKPWVKLWGHSQKSSKSKIIKLDQSQSGWSQKSSVNYGQK